MKKILLLLIILASMFFLFSCVKQVIFDKDDEKVVFIPEDVANFDLREMAIFKMSGKDYFYTITENHFGYYSMYGKTFINDEEEKIRFNTSVDIFYKEKDAKSLFDSNVNPLKIMSKNNIETVKFDEFTIDQVFLVNYEGYFSIYLRKKNLLYFVTIEGLDIEERQVMENLKAKVIYLIKNGKGKYRVF